jgi:hypothetical protein
MFWDSHYKIFLVEALNWLASGIHAHTIQHTPLTP